MLYCPVFCAGSFWTWCFPGPVNLLDFVFSTIPSSSNFGVLLHSDLGVSSTWWPPNCGYSRGSDRRIPRTLVFSSDSGVLPRLWCSSTTLVFPPTLMFLHYFGVPPQPRCFSITLAFLHNLGVLICQHHHIIPPSILTNDGTFFHHYPTTIARQCPAMLFTYRPPTASPDDKLDSVNLQGLGIERE